jgi:RecJ-like exonuclease
MKLINVNVNCKVCGIPGTVECDPAVPAVEGFLKFYTCDECMVKMGKMKSENRKARETSLPYPD